METIFSLPFIKYEGPASDHPLAFKKYDENKLVSGRSMIEHLRFAVSYWHSFCGTGADSFGEAMHLFPWNDMAVPIERAKQKLKKLR
jgi:xylose isomerase